LLSKGAEGAEALMKQLQDPGYKPPKGVDAALVERYLDFIDQAEKAEKPMDVQGPRREAMEMLHKFLTGKTADGDTSKGGDAKGDPKGK
jgi:hypothetical protein